MRYVKVLMQDRDWTLIVEALRHHGRNHPGEHAQYLRGLAVVIEEADTYDREQNAADCEMDADYLRAGGQ